MKNLFACSLLLSLLFGGASLGEGFQKKRAAPRRKAKKELSSKTIRLTIDELRRETERAAEVIKPANETEAKISSFVEAFDSFTRQLIGKVVAEARPSEGVKQAREFLDAHKAEMRAKYEAVNCISESKVSPKFVEEMKMHFFHDGVLIGMLMSVYGSDPFMLHEIRQLTNDYLEIMINKEPCPVESVAVL